MYAFFLFFMIWIINKNHLWTKPNLKGRKVVSLCQLFVWGYCRLTFLERRYDLCYINFDNHTP